MNVEGLLTLYKYNAYGHDLLFETIETLSAEQIQLASPSRDSIMGLLRHSLIVEEAYLTTCQGNKFDIEGIPTDSADILAEIRALAPRQQAFIENLSEADLNTTVEWYGIVLPVNKMLVQAVIHSLQHRIEISLLLSQAGHEMPDFDILKYFVLDTNQAWPF